MDVANVLLYETWTYSIWTLEHVGSDWLTWKQDKADVHLDEKSLIDNPNDLVTYPGDVSIIGLVCFMSSDPKLRNALLFARKLWYSGYKGRCANRPEPVSSQGRTELISSVAREMATTFRTNIACHLEPRMEACVRTAEIQAIREQEGVWSDAGTLVVFIMNHLKETDD